MFVVNARGLDRAKKLEGRSSTKLERIGVLSKDMLVWLDRTVTVTDVRGDDLI